MALSAGGSNKSCYTIKVPYVPPTWMLHTRLLGDPVRLHHSNLPPKALPTKSQQTAILESGADFMVSLPTLWSDGTLWAKPP